MQFSSKRFLKSVNINTLPAWRYISNVRSMSRFPIFRQLQSCFPRKPSTYCINLKREIICSALLVESYSTFFEQQYSNKARRLCNFSSFDRFPRHCMYMAVLWTPLNTSTYLRSSNWLHPWIGLHHWKSSSALTICFLKLSNHFWDLVVFQM